MKCAGHLQKTNEEYLYAMNEVHPSIEVLGKYIDIKTKVPLKCKVCEHEWSSVPYASIHQKTGCPKCNNNSKQEKILFEYIKEHYKEVKSQVTFDGLVGVGGGLLSYDIGLSLNGVDYLIERQGEQHEKQIPFGGITKERAIINFEIQKEHDRRKREYAKENSYKLIEIWYNEDYKEKLKEYGLCV